MRLKEFINWIFPLKCAICGCEISENSIFCFNCFSKLTFIGYPFCQKCGKLLESSYGDELICKHCLSHDMHFDLARALLQYDRYSKNIIMKIKKQSDNYISRNCALRLMTKYKETLNDMDLIIPVPSHWSRVLKRGYNPSSIIAYELSKLSGIKADYKSLKRIRKTQYQKNKNFEERFQNVDNAFKCTRDLSNTSVILVDDVFTTGATLNSCSKALRAANCKHINCLTIATTKSH